MSNDDKPQPTGWVAVEAEKPGRWVLQELPDEPDLPFRDQDGWQRSADVCLMPWSTKADVEAFMRSKGWTSDSFVPVNLDDLPAPAVAAPSEVEKLRSEVERLTLERDEARAEAAANADTLQDWKRTAESALRQKDALDEELSLCKQAHSAAEDAVESLRAQLGKATLSRRDEFAKAALTGLLANSQRLMDAKDTAVDAVAYADATIRALDGAVGA